MENSRWWHVAIAAVTALLVLLALLNGESAGAMAGAIGCLVLFVGGWILVGRHAWRSARAGVAFSAIIVVAAGVGTAFVPAFASIQFVAFTLVWTMAASIRIAIFWNLALTGSVLAGFLVSLGTTPAAVLQSLSVEAVSLAFSLAFGLWITSIADRSEERQRLLDELTATQEQLAAVNREVGVTEERERLARELHDTLAQDLTGLVMLAERARGEADPAARNDQLALLEENARAALAQTRSLVATSAPVHVGHTGIGDALQRLGSRFERETGVEVTVAVDLADTARDAEVVLLRCAQEGLANVRKHAGARHAVIDARSTGGALVLTVSDDGRGFDAASPSDGFGLPGLRDRLALVGGTLEVDAAPGRGATVTARLPIGARA